MEVREAKVAPRTPLAWMGRILNTGGAPENQHITKQFGGDTGVTYNVTLRVVGVAERYWYTGGMLDSASKVFYTGGLPTIHSAQAPNTTLAPGQGACKIHPPSPTFRPTGSETCSA